MKEIRTNFWIPILAFLVVLPSSNAQQQSSQSSQQGEQSQQSTSADKPIDTRVSGTPNKGNAKDTQDDAQQSESEDRGSLAGAFDLSLSSTEGRRSYWQPLFNVTSMVDTNPLTPSQTSGLTSWSALYGGLDVHRLTRHSDMTLSYLGGGLISNDGSADNAAVQQFEFADRVSWGRSRLSIFDLLDELPETSFGFSFPLTISLPAGQGVSLEPVFLPNESIITTRGERLGNASVAEFDRALTSKSSLTLVGGYSLLHFLGGSSLLNYGEATVQGGFDHQLTRRSTLGVLYRFNELRFRGIGQPLDAHTAQLSYGQRIGGRWSLRLAAGPAVSLFQAQVPTGTGSPGSTAPATRSTSQVYWTLDASINYQQRRTLYGVSYDHLLSGGGGVLPGAITDQVSGTVSNHFSNSLSGGLTAGYARNQSLNTPLTPLLGTGQVYNYWFGGASLSRKWGRWTSLDLNYQAQYQDSKTAFCVGVCQKSLLRQTGSIGLTWRPRPMLIQ